MLVALEVGLQVDPQAELAEQKVKLDRIATRIADVPTVVAQTFMAESKAGKLYLDIDWDEQALGISKAEFHKAIEEGTPSIAIRSFRFSKGQIELGATVMADGEERIVAERAREILTQNA